MPLDVVLEKHPSETYIFGLDFAPALATGRTISSGTVQALDSTGADVTATLLQAGTATISGTQAKAQFKAAGASGSSYSIIFTVTLDDGEVLQDGLTVSVKSLP